MVQGEGDRLLNRKRVAHVMDVRSMFGRWMEDAEESGRGDERRGRMGIKICILCGKLENWSRVYVRSVRTKGSIQVCDETIDDTCIIVGFYQKSVLLMESIQNVAKLLCVV